MNDIFAWIKVPLVGKGRSSSISGVIYIIWDNGGGGVVFLDVKNM